MDNAVSRQHVRIEVSGEYNSTDLESVNKITISDMNTKHGTKWNGESRRSLSVLIDRFYLDGYFKR